VRAFQVAPGELEGVLLDHPDIADAAVIGIPDPQSGSASELPRGYIVRKVGSEAKLDGPAIKAYMRERLAAYKMLEGGIVFVESIPKNASGKILKRILREQAKKEMGAKL
jgi:4-coumarate--CoA ligase